ncbi:hypothetical protein [Armatimonas sp.]|uniref:hypothetical protein n=1 Tax=Armatimonas sp. TaxID=1872638 RepID=UPI00286C5066|nr:hypothetical protein [Armatimonas sp.]
MFAEDEVYVPQLLQAYALLQGNAPLEDIASFIREPEPLPTFQPPPTVPAPPRAAPAIVVAPVAQRDNVLKPPPAGKEPTEFDRHHNAIRLYVIQQFEEGKKSREIAGMIGITPHKLARWYNQVKELPATMHLWIPLIDEEEVKAKESAPPKAAEAPEPEQVVVAKAPRAVEPSREAVKAARRALRNAAKNTQVARDQEEVATWIRINTVSEEDSAVASRLAALAFHRQEWSLSRISRALDLDVSTISRWMTRARQAEQAEEALQKGMDKRRTEQKLRDEQKLLVAATKKTVRRPQPRPKVALPRPIAPISAMAKRSVGMLNAILEQAETSDNGTVRLSVASAIERERVMAALSMLDVETGRPQAHAKGFLIPLLPEEASYLRRILAQG